MFEIPEPLKELLKLHEEACKALQQLTKPFVDHFNRVNEQLKEITEPMRQRNEALRAFVAALPAPEWQRELPDKIATLFAKYQLVIPSTLPPHQAPPTEIERRLLEVRDVLDALPGAITKAVVSAVQEYCQNQPPPAG